MIVSLKYGQILEKSDYTMISGSPFIKKTGKNHYSIVLLLVIYFWCMMASSSPQVGGRYHSISISLLRLKTRPLSLMRTGMFIVLNLWSEHSCSMILTSLISNFLSRFVPSANKYFLLVPRGGRFSDGWGSCERREKRFLKPNHDIPSTAETRAKNKACQVCSSFHFHMLVYFQVCHVMCFVELGVFGIIITSLVCLEPTHACECLCK